MTTPDLKEIIRVLRDYAMPMTGERLGERHPTIFGWTWDEIEKEVSSRPGVTVAEAAKVARVKPLEWKSRRISSKWERFAVDTLFGGYEILEHADGKISWNVTFFNADEPYLQYAAKNIEAAKAAAQADYSARVLAALTPDTEAKP